MDYAVGYACFFENIVVYVEKASDLLRMLQGRNKKLGGYLGVVKGVIPVDPYQVLYEYIHDTKGFKQRKKATAILKKLGLSRRKMRIMKAHGQAELTRWKRKT